MRVAPENTQNAKNTTNLSISQSIPHIILGLRTYRIRYERIFLCPYAYARIKYARIFWSGRGYAYVRIVYDPPRPLQIELVELLELKFLARFALSWASKAFSTCDCWFLSPVGHIRHMRQNYELIRILAYFYARIFSSRILIRIRRIAYTAYQIRYIRYAAEPYII